MHADQVITLVIVAAAAGWVDAVVGGGGLLQLPALMLVSPSTPVVSALATNKAASVAGTSTAAVTYLRRVKVDRRTMVPVAAVAVVSSGAGAACAGMISSSALRPIILVALLVVAAFVAAKPNLGAVPNPVLPTRRRLAVTILVTGVVIAFYDGLIGPGTGMFLVVAFTVLLGLDFVHGSAMAKVANAGTNLGAVVVFAFQGHVLWALGLAMAVGSMTGAQIGARMALNRGSGFVRVVLLCVVTALVIKLGYDQLRDL